jgi:hypothetical protein
MKRSSQTMGPGISRSNGKTTYRVSHHLGDIEAWIAIGSSLTDLFLGGGI